MPKLVILDGNSLLYRGFFAMRALSTSDRLPTNAVYSFVLMLLTILEREKPPFPVENGGFFSLCHGSGRNTRYWFKAESA